MMGLKFNHRTLRIFHNTNRQTEQSNERKKTIFLCKVHFTHLVLPHWSICWPISARSFFGEIYFNSHCLTTITENIVFHWFGLVGLPMRSVFFSRSACAHLNGVWGFLFVYTCMSTDCSLLSTDQTD